MTVEKRRHPRYICGGIAEIRASSTIKAPLCGNILNLSASGCRLLLDDPGNLHLGLIVHIDFTVNRRWFLIRGEIRFLPERTEPGQLAVGIEFMSMDARTQERLMELIGELEGRQRTLAKLPPQVSGEHSYSLNA